MACVKKDFKEAGEEHPSLPFEPLPNVDLNTRVTLCKREHRLETSSPWQHVPKTLFRNLGVHFIMKEQRHSTSLTFMSFSGDQAPCHVDPPRKKELCIPQHLLNQLASDLPNRPSELPKSISLSKCLVLPTNAWFFVFLMWCDVEVARGTTTSTSDTMLG